MIHAQFCAICFDALMLLPAITSTEAVGAVPVEEPALFSLTTLAAVIGAFVIALLIVAVVWYADR